MKLKDFSSYEEALKTNGLLLKSIPSKERTDELCLLAVRTNPKAIEFVPSKKQTEQICKQAIKNDLSTLFLIRPRALTEDLCLYALKQNLSLFQDMTDQMKTKKVCCFALAHSIKALQFVPRGIKNDIYPCCSDELFDACFSWIKEDISASIFLPRCLIIDHRILQYQKEQHCLFIQGSYFSKEIYSFCIRLSFCYTPPENGRATTTFPILADFSDFDEYYNFLDGNLNGAELLQCDFKGIDLRQYNTSGALIRSDVLDRYGLYDHSYYRSRITDVVDPISSIEDNGCAPEIITKDSRLKEYSIAHYIDFSFFEIYYISDLHLWHHIKNHFKSSGTQGEFHYYIRKLVDQMLCSVRGNAKYKFLMIAGDTSSMFEFAEVFYTALAQKWPPEKIIVVSGNHELIDPDVELEDSIQFYKTFFARLGIHYLHNEVLCIPEGYLPCARKHEHFNNSFFKMSEKDILSLSTAELHRQLSSYPLLVLGGLGFSGLNEKYNASTLRYGRSFDTLPRDEARQKDLAESARFEAIYNKLKDSIPGNRLIVLTHTPKDNWSIDPYIPSWIYINGHTHRNYTEVSDQRQIYADNQIGYRTDAVRLKYFYTLGEYDIFAQYSNGIYNITPEQYISFCRGKCITASFNRPDSDIYMLKKNGYYMFFYYGRYYKTSKKKCLYLASGGSLKNLNRTDVNDIQYFYDRIDLYTANVFKLLDRYTGAQKRLSQFIIQLGGSGNIHGCIIDIEKPNIYLGYSYSHLFVNPIDGTVTPYYAWDTKSRQIYKDLKSLLKDAPGCKTLCESYRAIEERSPSNLPVLHYGTNITEWGEDNSVYDEGGYLYKLSRIIKSLQYCTEKGIIRIWNEYLLDKSFVSEIMSTQLPEIAMNDKLIADDTSKSSPRE